MTKSPPRKDPKRQGNSRQGDSRSYLAIRSTGSGGAKCVESRPKEPCSDQSSRLAGDSPRESSAVNDEKWCGGVLPARFIHAACTPVRSSDYNVHGTRGLLFPVASDGFTATQVKAQGRHIFSSRGSLREQHPSQSSWGARDNIEPLSRGSFVTLEYP